MSAAKKSVNPPLLMLNDPALQRAALRLECLKLASERRTDLTTPEQTQALADDFIAYVMGDEKKNLGEP